MGEGAGVKAAITTTPAIVTNAIDTNAIDTNAKPAIKTNFQS